MRVKEQKMENIHSSSILDTDLLFIKVESVESCVMEIKTKQGMEILSFPEGWAGFICEKIKSLQVVSGRALFFTECLPTLCHLQVFMDLWRDSSTESKGLIPKIVIPTPGLVIADIEYWWIDVNLRKSIDADTQRLALYLRGFEYYGIVKYLFTEGCGDEKKLHDLSTKYGLSPSHFRRISKRALGSTAKAALCDWRLAKAILEIINEPDCSMTNIAMAHGYSSLSHFSNSVKCSIGLSPREIKKNKFDDI